jgi:hypothetical protein
LLKHNILGRPRFTISLLGRFQGLSITKKRDDALPVLAIR